MIITLHFTSNFEAFTTVTMINIFWNVTLLSSGYTHGNRLYLSGYIEDRHSKLIHNAKFLADIQYIFLLYFSFGWNKYVVIPYHTSVPLLYCQLQDDNNM